MDIVDFVNAVKKDASLKFVKEKVNEFNINIDSLTETETDMLLQCILIITK